MTTETSETIRSVAEQVRAATHVAIVGACSKAAFTAPHQPNATPLSTVSLTGIRDYSPADQVVVVGAGARVSDLQADLAAHGQCLPLPDPSEFGALVAGLPGTVGGLVAMRMPHALEAQCGSIRDWILGATMIRANGEIVKSGSMAVKSVAGYDVHRLMVGARGTLALVAEVILRTYPRRALPSPRLVWGSQSKVGKAGVDATTGIVTIRRFLRSEVDAEVAALGDQLIAFDPATATVWHTGDQPPTAASTWWSLYANRTPRFEPEPDAWDRRARATLDPGGKWNPGAWLE